MWQGSEIEAFAQFIGTFCGVLATMSPHSVEFARRMDALNRYVAMNGVEQDLRRRLREYLHQTKHLQIAASSKELLLLLSPADTKLAGVSVVACFNDLRRVKQGHSYVEGSHWAFCGRAVAPCSCHRRLGSERAHSQLNELLILDQ